MNLKINVPVHIVNWRSTFLVKLTEVDTFRDDTLAVKIQNLEGNAMGYRRQRNLPEVITFEFFISAYDINEIVGEIKAVITDPNGKEIAESDVLDFELAKAIISGEKSMTVALNPVKI